MVSNSTSQILLAILLLIILFAVGAMIYSADQLRAIRESRKQKKMVPIFVGIKDLKNNKDEEYNTLEKNPNNPNYRDIGSSINQPAGVEFTYNFWMYTDTSSTAVFKQNGLQEEGNKGLVTPDLGLQEDQIVLFVRGSKSPVTYNNLCSLPGKPITKTDILVKCPLVKLENKGDILTVEFNTMQGPDAVAENSDQSICDEKSTSWGQVHAYKLSVKGISTRTSLAKKWNMVTIVIRDTFPDDPYPLRNKVRCSIYINGGVELDKYVDGKFYSASETASETVGKSIIRGNQGNLYFAPNIGEIGTGSNKITMPALDSLGEKQLMIADLTFFNYAISTYEVKALFSKKLTPEYAASYGKPIDKLDDKAWMYNVSLDTRNNKLVGL